MLITHYMDEAVQADRVIVVDSGRIKMQGPPREVFSKVEALKALGLDTPQATELIWQLNRSGAALPEGILDPKECIAAILERIKQ